MSSEQMTCDEAIAYLKKVHAKKAAVEAIEKEVQRLRTEVELWHEFYHQEIKG